MKKLMFLFCFCFVLFGVFGQALEEDDNNNILDELLSGKISAESISVLSHYGSDGISAEQQSQFVSAINDLSGAKKDAFWTSFWDLSGDDRSGFINSFGMESKNELLNVFADQYVKREGREKPVIEFNLKGDVDVDFIKTKGGQEFVKLGGKMIFLDKFKGLNDAWETTTFDYDAETDTLTKMRGEGKLVVKGGNVVVGMDKFYVLGSDNKVDQEHPLNDMEVSGDIELDLTGDEPKMSLSSYEDGKKVSSVELKNGMRIYSLEDSDKVAEMVFDSEGGLKSIEDLDMQVPFFGDIKARNGKMRYVLDVSDLLDDGGAIDKERMEKLLLEGGSEGEYSGYFVYDKEGGKDGKPFVAAVADGAGIGEFGRLTNEALQEKKLDTINKLLGVDLKEQKTGSAFSSMDREALGEHLNEAQRAIDGLRGIVKSEEGGDGETYFARKKREMKNAIASGLSPDTVKKLAYAEIDKTLEPFLGRGLSDIDREVFSDEKFLDAADEAIQHFKERIKDENYFKKYSKGDDFDVDVIREDFDALMGVAAGLDSVYDSRVPRMTVSLASGSEIGTLVVGGNVEVYDGDLKISENLKGVSFGAGVVAGDDSFKVDSSIDNIYTTNSDNVWEIKENAEGGLEPFLVGGEKANVEISRLNIDKILIAKDRTYGAFLLDHFVSKSNRVEGRVVHPAYISFQVSEEGKRTMDESKGVVEYYDIKGPYELSVTFRSKVDTSDKPASETINKVANTKIAEAINIEIRTPLKNIIDILDMDVDTNSFTKERELNKLLKPKEGSSDQFFQSSMVGLIMEMPAREGVQAGVDLVSQGYTSYGNLRDVNLKKVSNMLNFIDTSLGFVQREYDSGGLDQDRVVISLVRKDNNDLFLRNSRGEVLSIDSEIELFVSRLIPLLTSQSIRETQNQVLNKKRYKFIRSATYYLPEKKESNE